MKLNSAYYSKDSNIHVIKVLDYLYTHLINELKQTFLVTEVACPLFLERNSDLLIESNTDRRISFDSGARGNINALFYDYSFWLTDAIERYVVPVGQGLLINARTIARDTPEDESSAIANDDLVLEIHIAKNINEIADFIADFTKKLYQIFVHVSRKVNQHFGIEAPPLQSYLEYVSSQLLENEFPSLPPLEREKSFLTEHTSFVLESPGQKLFSNQYHCVENPILYNLKLQNYIIIKNNVNDTTLRVAKISFRATEDVLENQIRFFSLDYLFENVFVQKMINKKKPWSIQIKINKLTLAMILLHKGHISEITPDDEVTNLQKMKKSKRISYL